MTKQFFSKLNNYLVVMLRQFFEEQVILIIKSKNLLVYIFLDLFINDMDEHKLLEQLLLQH